MLGRIKFYKRDVDNFCNDKYDLVISNPPYIKKHKLKYLGTVNFEPRIALDGGLDILEVIKSYFKIKIFIKDKWKTYPWNWHDQKYKVINFLKEKSFFINKIIKDYGNNARCIVSTKIN